MYYKIIKGEIIPKTRPKDKPNIISKESCALKYNLELDTIPVIKITLNNNINWYWPS